MTLVRLVFVLLAILLPRIDVQGEGTPRILQFEPNVISVDTIRYDAGNVMVRFECTNICDKSVVILDVRSQCGCAKPSFSTKSIEPGKMGYVDVVFDPKNLFADQKRHLTVVATNGDYRKFNTLTITGYVDRGVTEEEVRYPYVICPGLRSSHNTLGMRLSERGDVAVREFIVFNESSSDIHLDYVSDDRTMDLDVPDVIKPGKTAKVKVSVNTRRFPSGAYEKSVTLKVNGKDCPEPIVIKGAIK